MRQPGILVDMMLHETAVSWVRKQLAVTTPKENWLETPEEYSTRLKRCCDKVNAECDVEGLWRDCVDSTQSVLSLSLIHI